MPFHHIMSRVRANTVITINVELGHVAEVVFIRFLDCKITLSSTFPFSTFGSFFSLASFIYNYCSMTYLCKYGFIDILYFMLQPNPNFIVQIISAWAIECSFSWILSCFDKPFVIVFLFLVYPFWHFKMLHAHLIYFLLQS